MEYFASEPSALLRAFWKCPGASWRPPGCLGTKIVTQPYVLRTVSASHFAPLVFASGPSARPLWICNGIYLGFIIYDPRKWSFCLRALGPSLVDL